MDYRRIELRQEFRVEAVVSVHYFEYMNDFNFPGERHDFWEILCVDKGEITVTRIQRSPSERASSSSTSPMNSTMSVPTGS